MLVAGEDQASGRGKGAADQRIVVHIPPFDRAGGWINGREVTIGGLIICLRGSRATAPKGNTLDEDRRGFLHFAATLDHRDVDILRGWTVSGRVRAVLATYVPWTNILFVSPRHGHELRVYLRPTIFIEPFSPVEFVHVLSAVQIFARSAIEHVQEPVTVRLGERLYFLAAALHLDEKEAGVAVIVPDVVWRKLEMPLEVPAVGIESEHGVGVEIVTVASIAIPVWRGVTSRPEQHVLFGVIRTGDPGRPAAVLPRVARPGFNSFLLSGGDSIATPFALAGLRVVGVNETACAILAAGDADNNLVVDDQRCSRRAIADGIVVHFAIPRHGTGLAVKRDQPRIKRRHEHFVVGDSYTTIGGTTTDTQVIRQRVV